MEVSRIQINKLENKHINFKLSEIFEKFNSFFVAALCASAVECVEVCSEGAQCCLRMLSNLSLTS